MKEKKILTEKFRKPGILIPDYKNPKLHHIPDNVTTEIISTHVLEAGIVERGGKRYEYQVLRVLLKTD